MYMGYAGTALVTGGQSLHAILPAVGESWCIVAIGLISLAAAIYGHDLIHVCTRLMTYVAGGAVLLCFVWVLFVHPLARTAISPRAAFSPVGFFSMVSIGVFWQLGYAPYVSDYSRYLPPDTGPRQAFWACYWGSVIGAVLPMILGALIGPAVVGGDVVEAISRLTGPASTLIVLLFAPGVAVAGAICIYGGALAVITLIQTFATGWRARSRARALIATAIFIAALLIGLVGATNFLPLYGRFNEILLYVMVPWTAVNLVDYYLIRHGDYDVPSFFAPDGGIYGRYNSPLSGVTCWEYWCRSRSSPAMSIPAPLPVRWAASIFPGSWDWSRERRILFRDARPLRRSSSRSRIDAKEVLITCPRRSRPNR